MQRKQLGKYTIRTGPGREAEDMVGLVQRRWRRLTARDLEEAGLDRAALARIIARRYRVTVGEAKRQVRDFLRVVAVRKSLGGKRGRKVLQRFEPAGPGGEVVFESVVIGGSVATGGLGGDTGTDPDRIGPGRGGSTESSVPGGLGGEIGTEVDR